MGGGDASDRRLLIVLGDFNFESGSSGYERLVSEAGLRSAANVSAPTSSNVSVVDPRPAHVVGVDVQRRSPASLQRFPGAVDVDAKTFADLFSPSAGANRKVGDVLQQRGGISGADASADVHVGGGALDVRGVDGLFVGENGGDGDTEVALDHTVGFIDVDIGFGGGVDTGADREAGAEHDHSVGGSDGTVIAVGDTSSGSADIPSAGLLAVAAAAHDEIGKVEDTVDHGRDRNGLGTDGLSYPSGDGALDFVFFLTADDGISCESYSVHREYSQERYADGYPSVAEFGVSCPSFAAETE